MRRVLSLAALSIALALFMSGSAVAADDAKGSIAGKVLDKDGKGVKDATVLVLNPADVPAPGARGGAKPPAKEAAPNKGDKPAPGGGRGGPGALAEKAVAKGTTDADGAYKIADVPAGKYVIVAMAKGAGRGKTNIEVTAGQEAKADDIKLEPRPAGGNRPGGKKGPAAGADAPK